LLRLFVQSRAAFYQHSAAPAFPKKGIPGPFRPCGPGPYPVQSAEIY